MALNSLFEAARHWLRPGHPKSRGRRFLVGALGLAAAWAVFGGQQGIFALLVSQREKASLRTEIEDLKKQNVDLENRVDLLQHHPEAYERTARERLLLMRPGETIYRFR